MLGIEFFYRAFGILSPRHKFDNFGLLCYAHLRNSRREVREKMKCKCGKQMRGGHNITMMETRQYDCFYCDTRAEKVIMTGKVYWFEKE